MLDIDPKTESSRLHAADRTMLVQNLAARAWKDMQQHDIPPTPRNFELWFTYLSGSNLALSQELSDLLRAGDTPTPQQLRSLYSDYMTSEISVEAIADHSEQLDEAARALVEQVVENEASLRTLRWPASSRHRFALVKWSLCRLLSCDTAGEAVRRKGVARPE